MPPQTCFLRLYHNSGFFSTKDDKYFEVYRSATSVFAPALARSPRGRVFGGCTVTQRSYSLPRDLSTTLEMTRRGSVSFYFIRLFCKYGHRRLAIGGSPTGGRGTPLPRSIESKYGQVFGFSCSLGFIPIAGDFSTNARNDNVFTWFYCYFDRFCRSGRGTPLPFKAFPLGGATRRCEAP